MFGAFIKVYKARTADLFRIATEGTGVLREGEIHPDLANRLADEAARCAFYVLQMCIRAIDYCPPVGITFGGYLRAIVTADHDVNPEDAYGYRLAFVESFRQWGISPKGMRSMSVESLLWPTGDEAMEEAGVVMENAEMNALVAEERSVHDSETSWAQSKKKGRKLSARLQPWNLESNRYNTWERRRTERGRTLGVAGEWTRPEARAGHRHRAQQRHKESQHHL